MLYGIPLRVSVNRFQHAPRMVHETHVMSVSRAFRAARLLAERSTSYSSWIEHFFVMRSCKEKPINRRKNVDTALKDCRKLSCFLVFHPKALSTNFCKTTTTTTTMRWAALFLWATLLSTTVPTTTRASPQGALNCLGGTSAPGNFHRSSGFVEDSLAAGDIVVEIDGLPLSTDDQVLDFWTGQTYNVTISRRQPNAFFRGVMARINGGEANVDASLALSIVEGDPDLQPNQFCLDDPELVGTRKRNCLSLQKRFQ